MADSDPETGTSGTAMFAALDKRSRELRLKSTVLDRADVREIVMEYERAAKSKRLPPLALPFVTEAPFPGRPATIRRVIDANTVFKAMNVQVLKDARTKTGIAYKTFQANIQKYITKGFR